MLGSNSSLLFGNDGKNLVITQSPITAEKVQIKAMTLVFATEFLVVTITIGSAIANKIRETKSQFLSIDEIRERTKGKISIDSTIRIIFLLGIDLGVLSSLSSFFVDGVTAVKISINATTLRIVVTIARILVKISKESKDIMLITGFIMINRNKKGVAFAIF